MTDFFYFFGYHASHGVAFFAIVSAFSDFGAAFNALLLGPSTKVSEQQKKKSILHLDAFDLIHG